MQQQTTRGLMLLCGALLSLRLCCRPPCPFGTSQQHRKLTHGHVQAVPADHTIMQAFMGEFAAAFMLVVIVCTTALDRKGDPSRMPVVMALTVPLLIFTVGPVSSMCINPARAFGPALASGMWDNHWIWWTAPILGGLAAAVPYKLLCQREEEAEPQSE